MIFPFRLGGVFVHCTRTRAPIEVYHDVSLSLRRSVLLNDMNTFTDYAAMFICTR